MTSQYYVYKNPCFIKYNKQIPCYAQNIQLSQQLHIAYVQNNKLYQSLQKLKKSKNKLPHAHKPNK